MSGRSTPVSSQRVAVLLALVLGLSGSVQPAWAVQGHGGAEGLVSHEIGHVLYVAGMLFMLFHVMRSRFRSAAWMRFRCFLCFMILWNFLTFSGHWMREYVASEQFHEADGHTVAFTVSNPSDAFFYLTRLDHLLLVPALLCLLLALRKWRAES